MARRLSTRRSGGTNPSNIVPPTISGSAAVGQVLTCNPGRWVGLNPLTISYQWIRGASTNIGTNSPNYTLVAGDSTFTVKCQVNCVNAVGAAAATTPSTATIP